MYTFTIKYAIKVDFFLHRFLNTKKRLYKAVYNKTKSFSNEIYFFIDDIQAWVNSHADSKCNPVKHFN